MKKVLICEDEDAIRDFEVLTLTRAGYEVTEAACGEDAVKLFEAAPDSFSVILLDIMMPGIDGFAVCKKIREKNKTVGVIMLSAKSQEMDKVTGLTLGADDYITKPFSPSELTARVDAICRRIDDAKKQVEVLISEPFVLNLPSRSLTKNGVVVDVSRNELSMMELFLSRQGIALSRNDILDFVWGINFVQDSDGMTPDKIVDVNVRRLRMKIEDEPSQPVHLTTVRGYGYKWVP